MIALPEGAARWISHLLLGGWLWLVGTLLLPLAPGHSHGTLLFWGTTLPLILALLALVGTAPWRRICPLAHVSQLPRALGRHRGSPRLVPPLSWLGRHHLRLQWGLLVSLPDGAGGSNPDGVEARAPAARQVAGIPLPHPG